MREDLIVRHCAPTLAGLKTGSLFSCRYENFETLRSAVRHFNALFKPFGVRVLPARISGGKVLIYVYRPLRLAGDLSEAKTAQMLSAMGYDCRNSNACVAGLLHKLNVLNAFPHEIGLFLGYPAEDVRGFIDNNGENFKCVGCWKVYCNESKTRALFRKYKKCTEIYCRKWGQGVPVVRLIVAV